MIKNSQKLLKFWGKDGKKAKNGQNSLNSFDVGENSALFEFFSQFGTVMNVELSIIAGSAAEFRISLASEEFIDDMETLNSQARESGFLIRSWEVQSQREPLWSGMGRGFSVINWQQSPTIFEYRIRGIFMPPPPTPI